MTLLTIEQIKQANTDAGYYFFEPDTMRFFDSKVLLDTYPGNIFITSEQFDRVSPRLYTVRQLLADGGILTLSKFQEFPSIHAAKKFAKEKAKNFSLR